MFLITSSLIPLSFGEGTIGIPQCVLRDLVISVKFLDAYFGTDGSKYNKLIVEEGASKNNYKKTNIKPTCQGWP